MSYKFRLTPTEDQESALLVQCAHSRFIYNLGLEQRNLYDRRLGPTPNFYGQSIQLTEARRDSWLKEGSSIIQQQALKDLDQAFKNWWKRPDYFGKPSWRKSGQHESFRIVGNGANRWERLSRKWGRVDVPKIGWVTFRWSRHPGEAKSYRIKLDTSGKWWISFIGQPPKINGSGDGNIVGVDCGIANSYITSEAEIVRIPKIPTGEAARLLRLQRRASRQLNGSSNKKKTKRAINRVKARQVNRKKDIIEKFTTDLARQNDFIFIEDLKIQKMVKSAAGTMGSPGVDVAQKRGLNRSIAEQGWGLFAKRLIDKVGDRVVKVNPAYTSQQCNNCGHTCRENRENQAAFKCVSCEHVDNADLNAAKNIRDTGAGLALAACGDLALAESVKQEPPNILIGSLVANATGGSQYGASGSWVL